MSKNDGGPAFPWGGEVCGGMSLRDYFASKAMQALIEKPFDDLTDQQLIEIPSAAYLMADAMLAARDQQN